MCFLMMFQMDPVYAVLAIAAMFGFYMVTRLSPIGAGTADLADLFRGVMGQATRWMQIQIQRASRRHGEKNWRPSVIAVGEHTFTKGSTALLLMSWMCERQGFGTYLHHLRGMLDRETYTQTEALTEQLVQMCRRYPGVYADALVSPSRRSALAQCLQVPGVSGLENNTVLFELDPDDATGELASIVDDAVFAAGTGKNILLLRGAPGPVRGERRTMHVWLTWHDADNANLMLLLSYIILGHSDWRGADIRVFAAFPSHEAEEQELRFRGLVEEGRLPVSRNNLFVYRMDEGAQFRAEIERTSADADLVIMGLTPDRFADRGVELCQRFPSLRQVLYVIAQERVLIQ
jgi:hypothetical protein